MTHVFVNLGSDHPSFLEAMAKGQKEKKDEFPNIITCPNEVNFTLLQLFLSSNHASRLPSDLHTNPTFSHFGRWLPYPWPMATLV